MNKRLVQARSNQPAMVEYSLSVDADAKAVLVFMQKNIPTQKLIGTAKAIYDLARIVWGQYGEEDVTPATLVPMSIISSTESKRLAAT